MKKINREKTTPTSSSVADDALWALVRLLARQTARDRLAGSPAPADPTLNEEATDDQA